MALISTIGYPEIQKYGLNMADAIQKGLETSKLAAELPTIGPAARADLALKQLKVKYPGLGETGMAGQIAYANYLRDQQLENQGTEQPSTPRTPVTPQIQTTAQPQGENQSVEKQPSIPDLHKQNLSNLSPQLSQSLSKVPDTSQINSTQEAKSIFADVKKDLPTDLKDQADLIQNSVMLELNRKKAETDMLQKKLKSYTWDKMPVQFKSAALAQASSFGYNPDEAARWLQDGHSLKDLATAKGYKENGSDWPNPSYPITQTMLTQQQRATVSSAELDAIEPLVTNAMKKYLPRYANISPDLISDLISGKNEDEQARVLAAYALQPEIAALRIKAANGTVGLTAIHDMISSAQGRISSLGFSPKSGVYAKMQKYMTDWINVMRKAGNSSLYKIGSQMDEEGEKTTQQEELDFSKMSDEDLANITGKKG